jgi:serine/threonine protein phosphatase PrpC
MRNPWRPTHPRPVVDASSCAGSKQRALQDFWFTGRSVGGDTIAVVCDGVSGARNGGGAADVASSMLGAAATDVRRIVEDVHALLLDQAPLGEWQTMVVGIILGTERACCFHSGDSWVMEVCTGAATRLAAPHSTREEEIRAGRLSEFAAKIVCRSDPIACLGQIGPLRLGIHPIEGTRQSRFLLATDGVEVLQPREIAAIARRAAPRSVAHELVAAAKRRGLVDDATVVSVAWPEPMTRETTELRLLGIWGLASAALFSAAGLATCDILQALRLP